MQTCYFNDPVFSGPSAVFRQPLSLSSSPGLLKLDTASDRPQIFLLFERHHPLPLSSASVPVRITAGPPASLTRLLPRVPQRLPGHSRLKVDNVLSLWILGSSRPPGSHWLPGSTRSQGKRESAALGLPGSQGGVDVWTWLVPGSFSVVKPCSRHSRIALIPSSGCTCWDPRQHV